MAALLEKARESLSEFVCSANFSHHKKQAYYSPTYAGRQV
jgi:hypothetical protein